MPVSSLGEDSSRPQAQLKISQRHVVDPNAIGLLADVAIKLYGNVQFLYVDVRLGILPLIHRKWRSVDRYADVMHLAVGALEGPGHVGPGICAESSAADPRRHPF